MDPTIRVKALHDHIVQLAELKQQFMKLRGFGRGANGAAIPRTTHADVAALTAWWHGEYTRALLRSITTLGNDKSQKSRTEWTQAKAIIDSQTKAAEPAALYPDNEWLWQRALPRLAIYLESLKVVPSDAELIVSSVKETVAEHAEAAKNLAKDAAGSITEAGERALSMLKTGAIIAGGVLAAAIVVPPIIRALKDD
jgi:hypothetical protein